MQHLEVSCAARHIYVIRRLRVNRQISIKCGVWRLRYNLGTESILHSGPAQRVTKQKAQIEICDFNSKTAHHTIRCIT